MNYRVVSGAGFGIIAVLQITRAILQVPIRIGSFEVPIYASWVAAAVTGGLCIWAFRSRS
jgi:hypothetical protein